MYMYFTNLIFNSEKAFRPFPLDRDLAEKGK